MLFNSVAFAVFMPIVFFIYWLIPQKFRWVFLLISSYYYYMSWEPKYVVWILLTTGITYLCGRFIEKTDEQKKKKLYMALAAILSLGLLIFFKYFNFISTSVTSILHSFSVPVSEFTLKLMMPVGISFYTFQSVGYVADVYRGKVSAERNLGKYALFISFFPQVLSGPIARADNLLPQLNEEKTFDYDKAAYGLRQMAWGFFKKLVVSSICAQYVDMIYNNVTANKGFVLITSTVLYAFQIYCDFSGYSDIAIGTAKLLGIDLMVNFKSPYFAQSIKEFWSRWHISLSSWFRDYIYIPMGGNRCSKARYSFNILVTFLVSGLWHGAAWTFIIWGLLHGALQVIETFVYKIKAFSAQRKKEKKLLSFRGVITLALTFSIVCFTWIFFRANSISDAFYIIRHMFDGIASPVSYLSSGISQLGFDMPSLVCLGFSMVILVIGDYVSLRCDMFERVGKLHPVVKFLIYFVVVFAIVVMTPSDASQEFIYFQF